MILYEGPSLIDGSPIVAIATEDENPKTGRMLFTWIMRQDRPPEVSVRDGSDFAVCGGCRWRARFTELPIDPFDKKDGPYQRAIAGSRGCYVRLTPDGSDGNPPADEATPPSVVWRRWNNGEYPAPHPDTIWNGEWRVSIDHLGHPVLPECVGMVTWIYAGSLPVRIGSWGDPAAVPTRVWAELVRYTRRWTGYTHVWKTCDPELKKYCMASVDTPKERAEARALGWRTFMVVPDAGTQDEAVWFLSESEDKGDILCPATDPRHQSAACSHCLLCSGLGGEDERLRGFKSVWEVAHGVNKENHTWP